VNAPTHIKNSPKTVYPFGMHMPGRSFSSGSYRYGFNKGSEKDNEIAGEGNHYTTFFRELDTRLGRWWSVDPKVSPSYSPYSSMINNPIFHSDKLGDKVRNKYEKEKKKAQEKYNKEKKRFENKYGKIDEELLKKNKKRWSIYQNDKKRLDKIAYQFEKINSKYMAAKKAIDFIKENFPEEFEYLNNITLGNGEIIDVVLEVSDEKFYRNSEDPVNGTMSDLRERKRRNAVGFTIGPQSLKKKNEYGYYYFRVGVVYKIRNEFDVVKTTYHEFRHVFYKLNKYLLKKTEEEQVSEDTQNAFKEIEQNN
jgi:hypothetical protein